MAASLLFRHSSRDGALVALAFAHGAMAAAAIAWARRPLELAAAALVTAVGLWWSSNTISHNHLHNPLFRSPTANRLFALYLSALLGVPQAIWRHRHLAHHAGAPASRPVGGRAFVEMAAIAATWALLAALATRFFVAAYLPGYVAGLALCWLQGHYEHTRSSDGVSHYGALYNRLWFNDGYHAEHHLRPGAHWSELPARVRGGAVASPWPPLLRFLDGAGLFNRGQARALDALERLALAWPRLQRFMLRTHEKAFRALLPLAGPAARIAVVGGGLFPRTVLVLKRLLPSSQLTVIDESAVSTARARGYLAGQAGAIELVEFINARFDPAIHRGFDLIIVPLGYRGDRELLYRAPPAPSVIVHDWLWRRRGRGARISLLLLKRLNLVAR
jgi:fatty acid desaturase